MSVLSADSESEPEIDSVETITAPKRKPGRKKADKVESEASEESDFDLFDDRRATLASKSAPLNPAKSFKKQAKTSAQTNPVCDSCGKPLVKRNCYFCQNGCKKKSKK